MNGIFLRIPALWWIENLPKLPSFNVNPSVARLFSSVASSAATTVSASAAMNFLANVDALAVSKQKGLFVLYGMGSL